MGKKLAVGFAGAGDVERENVFALLDDQLTAWDELYDDVIFVVPDKPKRGDKAMKHVRDFLEDEEVGLTEEDYDELVRAYEDSANICSMLVHDGDDQLLILAPKLDDEGGADDLTEELMEAAGSHEIPIKDLTHSLDDLIFDDDEEESAPAEPVEETEEEPEKPRKRRSRPEIDEGRQETLDNLKDLREASEGRREVPAVIASENPGKELLNEASEAAADEAQARTLSFAGIMAAESDLGAKSSSQIFESPLTIDEQIRQIVRDEVTRQLVVAGLVKSAEMLDNEELIEVYKDEDGGYRKKGRGRPRKGEETLSISKAEARELGLDV